METPEFEVKISENSKGEYSLTIIDYKTKQKSEYTHEELKAGLAKTGSLIWFGKMLIDKTKPVFRS